MKIYKILISGMHCTSCSMLIENDLEDLNGITSATCNYAKAECIVKASDDFEPLNIINTITNLGYKAKLEN